MKNKLTLILSLFLISTISSQNEIAETIFTEYSKHNINFDHPKIKEYSQKYAQIYHDMCMKILSANEIASKLEALSIAYSNHFKTISKKDKASLTEVSNLLNIDCNEYVKKRNLIKDMYWAKAQLREQNKILYEEVEDAKIYFEDVSFGEFAIEIEELTFKRCTTDMKSKEYDFKVKQIKQKYIETLKSASKKDMETLTLLYKIILVKCSNFDIEKQFKINK